MAEAGEGKSGGAGRRAVREARLADKLRQNLVKRKAKARAARKDADQRRGPTAGANEREP